MPIPGGDEPTIVTAETYRDLIRGHRQPYLAVHDSPVPAEFGTYFVLLAPQAVIGRDSSCSVRLLADSVSGRHALISVDAEGPGARAHLENLSRQKTAIESADGLRQLKQGEKALLQPGAKVHLGGATIRFDLFMDLASRLQQQLEQAVTLMRQGQHQEATHGLSAVNRYRAAGGTGATSVEQTLAAARYYDARIDSLQGRWNRASETLDDLLKWSWFGGEQRVRALFHRGMLSVARHDLREALRLADQAVEVASKATKYSEALARCLRGMVEARLRKFADAAESFGVATRALSNVFARGGVRDGGTLSKRLLLEQAIASYLNEHHDLALDQLDRVLRQVTGEAPSAKAIRGEALRHAGIIRSLRRDFPGAYTALAEALRTFQTIQNRYQECKAQKSLALNYLSWGRLEEAEFHLQQCEELLANEVENPYERSVVAAQLGKVLLSRGDAAAALDWFGRERDYQAGVPGTEHAAAYTHRNHARALRDLGRSKEAVHEYEQAADGFSHHSNRVQLAITLMELAGEHLATSNVNAAEEVAVRVEEALRESARGGEMRPGLLALQARLCWARGDPTQAIQLFEEGLQALSEAPASYLLAETQLQYGRLRAEMYRQASKADSSTAGAHLKAAIGALAAGIRCAQSQNLMSLVTQLEKEMRALDPTELVRLRLHRFVNREVVDILSGSDGPALMAERYTDCTVLFADLSGYTSMVEREPLLEVKRVLDQFFGSATSIVRSNGGVVEKFIGDCVMAVFKGAVRGVGLNNQAIAALKSALEIAESVDQLSHRRVQAGRRTLSMTAGLSTGPVLIGCFGGLEQMDFTLIGDTVNVASRLQSLAKPGQIAISSETYQAYMQGGVALWTVNQEAMVTTVKNREQQVKYWILDRAMRVVV